MTFTTIRELGRGYFGTVMLEFDESLGRLCATKYANANHAALGADSFAEARTMLAAKHPNVVEIFQADIERGAPLIRMEYLARGSVADKLLGGPAEIRSGIGIITDAARGLEYLHSLDLLHRDIKASNLLIADNNDVKLADFGLAGVVTQPKTLVNVGYRLTWPPENISSGKATDSKQGDIYALGIAAFRILNGDSVYFANMPDQGKLSAAIRAGRFPNRNAWLPHVHEPLRRVVRKAIHPDPVRRFATAKEFRHALERRIPVISWSYSQVNGEAHWTASKSGKNWHALITRNAPGDFSFEVSSSRAGSKARRNAADSISHVQFNEAANQAQAVLSRIAVNGR